MTGDSIVKPLVYMAGPLTTGNMAINTNRAIHLWNRLVETEVITPFCPHFTTLGDLILADAVHYETYMRYDFEIIARSDALLRLKGASGGADREVEHATSLGIPVFYEDADIGYVDLIFWATEFCKNGPIVHA